MRGSSEVAVRRFDPDPTPDGHVAVGGITGGPHSLDRVVRSAGDAGMSTLPLPGGPARRRFPTGLATGRTRHRIADPDDALALVAPALGAAEDALRSLVAHEVEALPHVARYLIDAGGKRLRPALTALGARALGLEPSPELMCCGELIHLGSLLHDDVVDQGDVRRGRSAAHVAYGNAVAVLAGDLCVAKALITAAQSGGPVAAEALAGTVAEMAAGEVLQLQNAGRIHDDVDVYLEVIERKSASLLSWCASAAALATGDVAAAEVLGAYGRLVGLAFQITDDVLDFREGTGKLPGVDLRERKVTLPLVHAMHRIDGLRERLADHAPDDAEVAAIVAEVAASGALEAALDDAEGYVHQALDALEELPDSDGRDALAVLASSLVGRRS
jgi:octaprenyl-diphosphate synthase